MPATTPWPTTTGRIAPFADDPNRACADLPTDVFYPEQGKGVRARQEAAKQVCRSCPLLAECLDWAIEQRESGVWGGTTDIERTRERKRRAEAAAGSRVRPVPAAAARRAQVARLTAEGKVAHEIADELGVATRHRAKLRTAA